MAGCGFNGSFESGCEMPGYDLKSDFGFNGCLRLPCLTSMSATRYNVASVSMADCGFDGLTSMPGYELKNDLDFNGWLRLQWLGFGKWLGLLRCLGMTYKGTALLRAEKWLRL
jgi:hypothetical protein